ncbi:hypothetical protein DI487_01360 [Flavobacterium sediminis]|uniref:Uncharacterized protein n=1 Tax=Flavobacterium sediminis TaxID=2201181 RepID=A0A2U8QR88_9FLAO|nr:AsmA-like C-terminal region-containing protein [Flavobacterium sediminis]AWM12648.1 hypothetical protein DI487_01360 [Flavobacterium sediminis]
MGSGSLPVSKGILKIEKGKVAYKKSSGTINLLEADINWLVDLKAKEKTQIDIHKLIVQGTGIQLNAKADVKRILTAPQITADLQSDIDLTQLKKAFPVSTNYHFEGKAVLDAKTNLNYDLAKNEVDYKNIILSGKCFLNNLKFKAPKDTISIDIQKTEIEVDKNQMESFVAHLDVEQLNLNYKDFHQIHSKKMKADLARGKKVGSKYPIDVNLAIEQLNYSSKDSIGGEVENTNLLLKVIPGKGEESSIFSAALASQKLKARQKDKKIFIEDGNYTFSVQKDKIKDKDWYPKGSIAFNKLVAIIPELGIPCLVKKTRVNFEDRNITLDNAFVALGKSKMRLSGNINNVFPRDKKDTTLYASLSVRSRYIDANQLMSAMHNNTAAVNNLEKVTEEKLDSEKTVTQKSVFKIPANINFSLDTSVDKLAFGDLEFSNIKGDVSIKESQLNLSNLSLKLNEAELQTKFKYKPVDETSAKIFYSMSIHNIEMEQIKDMVPVIDTLLPVAKTLEGKADFVIKGMMTINESMEPVIKTVKSIAALKAQNLKITESEAFKELAKTFMFKDKSNATIDNLEVEMLIEDSHLEILPALVEVDRYQLAIGGIQNVDLSYNYHISVLKSQIPFKTGVDVKGIIPNYDISLSKAKYKYYFTDKERLQSKADSTLIKKKAFIQDKIKF